MTPLLERDGPHRFELTAGGALHFVVRGPVSRATRPVFLLPSLGGSAGAWGSFGRSLARTERTIELDPRGFGASSEPPVRMGTRELARDVVELLERLGVESATVFGISFGGLLASWIAADAPRRVERLVLVSTAARGVDFSAPGLYRSARLAECIVEEDPKACAAREIVADEDSDAADAAARSARRDRWSRPKIARFLAMAAFHSLSRRAIGRIECPVLLLSGARDPILRGAAVRRFASQLRDVEERVLPDVGHDLVNEAPEALASLTREFLRAQRGRPVHGQ